MFRALKLGDVLVSTPALRAVRAALPAAEVTLVGLPWAAELAARLPHLVDRFVPFPGADGLPEQPADPARLAAFLDRMRAERFDPAVQLHGSGKLTNPLVAAFGAARTAGFYRPGEWCPDPARFLAWPEAGLELRRLLALTAFLGFPAVGEHLEFPLTAGDRRAAREAVGERPGGYAVVHPGAAAADRRYPPEGFAAVADGLAVRGLTVVLTGTAGEAPLTAAVAAAMRHRPVDLTGRTDLGATAAVLAAARVAVVNDTGVSHLAAAVGAASVVVSVGDHPRRWAPVDAARNRVVARPTGWPDAAEVAAAAAEVLESHPGAHAPGSPGVAA